MGQLILVCGEWKLARKRWYFVVDVQRGSRMILAEDRMRYENLIGMVFDDYGLDKTEYDVKLSYMLAKEVLQKLPQDTPPVYISNCRQLQLFLGQSAENCRRLCVELKEKLDMKLTSENAAQLEEICLKEQDEIPKEEQNLDEDSDEDYAFRFDYCDDSDGTDSGDENFEAFGLVHEEVIEEDEEVKEEEEAFKQEEDEVKAGEDDENLKLPPKKRGGPLFVSEGNASVGNIVKFDLNKLELCDGQCFDTKEQLVTRMKILSVVQKFDFDVHKSTPSLLAAKCWVKGCSWRVRATPKGDYPRFHVRKYVPHHTCSVTERSGRSRQATHEILALLYKDFVGGVGPSVLPMHVAEALNKRFQTKNRVQNAKLLTVQNIDAQQVQVTDVGGGAVNVVNLRDKKCTCRRFDLEKLPCDHAIAAAEKMNISRISLCHLYYHRSYLYNAYSTAIMPRDFSVPVPEHVATKICCPPIPKQQPGRPKKSRMKSLLELAMDKKRRRKQNACGYCNEAGHNRQTCKLAKGSPA